MGILGSSLTAGQTMHPGDFLVSAGDRYYAGLIDGDFCVMGGVPGAPQGVSWKLGKACSASSFLIMQTDGNLCIYQNNGNQQQGIWYAMCQGQTNFLVMQDDGNLCVYSGASQAQQGAFHWGSIQNGGRRLAITPSTPNAELFTDYDMLFILTQKTVNDQMMKLAQQKVIASHVVLVQSGDGASYQQYPDANGVPRESDGKTPSLPYLDVTVQPRITIETTGTVVTLHLDFVAGSAWFWVGAGPRSVLKQHDVTGWSYGIQVSLDLADAARTSTNLDASVRNQLNAFTPDMFSVTSLLADLANVSLATFDSAQITTSDSNTHTELSNFMTYYLKDLKAAGSLFLFGFQAAVLPEAPGTIHSMDRHALLPGQHPNTTPPPDNAAWDAKLAGATQLPPTLQVSGTTYTLTRHPTNPDLSTLTYALVTRGCHGHVPGSPPNVRTSWFPDGDGVQQGRVYNSYAALLRPLVLEPVFAHIRDNVYNSVCGTINDLPPNNVTYDQACQPRAGGWNFNVIHADQSDNRYYSSYTVDVVPGASPSLNVNGSIYIFKQHSTNTGFGEAQSWVSANVTWGGPVTFSADGNGQIIIGSNLVVEKVDRDSGHNAGASLFSISDPDLGSLPNILGGLNLAVNRAILCPVGDILRTDGITLDGSGNISQNLRYR